MDKVIAGCTKEQESYLIKLRDSGVTNMFGAAPYLRRRFGLDKDKASEVLMAWMASFE